MAESTDHPVAWQIISADPQMRIPPTANARIATVWRSSGLTVRSLYTSQAAADDATFAAALDRRLAQFQEDDERGNLTPEGQHAFLSFRAFKASLS